MKVSDVNKVLSRCRVSTKDDHLKLLMDIKDPNFFIHRMKELVFEIEKGVSADKLIQVCAIYEIVKRDSLDGKEGTIASK